MKKPNLKDLAHVEAEDSFSQAVITERKKAAHVVRKTFSFEQVHLDYLNTVALELSKKAGKPVGTSEALRFIIERDWKAHQ